MIKETLAQELEKRMGDNEQEQAKNINKRSKLLRRFNKKLIHLEEFIIVGVVALLSFMLAHMTGIHDESKNTEIAAALQSAINQVQPGSDEPRIISQWRVDSPVQNTFYKGYCTYGAALISPEFFPYLSPNEQQRTWGGNAVDRYLNAQLAGFPVGSEPREGALIIYKKGDRFVNAGHVGKVLKYFPEYKKMIVRDMNRVGRSIMSDRREYESNDNILGYIYPKPGTIVENEERVDENAELEVDIEEEDIELVLSLPEIPVEDNTVDSNKPLEVEYTTTDTGSQVTGHTKALDDPIVEVEPIVNPLPVNQKVDLDLAGLSLEAQHFLSQWDVNITTDLNLMQVGDTGEITIEITNKQDGSKFSGILPVAFNLVTSSSAITLDYSTVQLVFGGEATITATSKKAGKTAILLNFGHKQVSKIVVESSS